MTDLPAIDFVLTPQERDRAALAAVHLEENRRRQNDRDALQRQAQQSNDLGRTEPERLAA